VLFRTRRSRGGQERRASEAYERSRPKKARKGIKVNEGDLEMAKLGGLTIQRLVLGREASGVVNKGCKKHKNNRQVVGFPASPPV